MGELSNQQPETGKTDMGKNTAAERSPTCEPLQLIPDIPVSRHDVDELGLFPFSKTIAEAALGTRGPFTIGVYGEWGTGKTSLLKQAQSLIEAQKDSSVATVWFDAWKYEQESHLIVPLLYTIAAELKKTKSLLSRCSKTAWDECHDTLRSVGYAISIRGGVFSSEKAINRAENLKRQRKDFLRRSSLYFDAFTKLEKMTQTPSSLWGKSDTKIVLFIDDLDRCHPDQAVRLLQGIKLILAQPGFVVVFAVCPSILEAYLEKVYKEDYGVPKYDHGTSYLEKLVQLPFNIPPHEGKFPKFIEGILQNKTRLNDTDRKLFQELSDALSWGTNHNPRALIRTINNLLIYRQIYTAILNGPPWESMIAICAVSQMLRYCLTGNEENIYHRLVEEQDLCDLLLHTMPQNIREQLTPDNDSVMEESGGDPNPYKNVIAAFMAKPFLVRLLNTKHGKQWLSNPEKRRIANLFALPSVLNVSNLMIRTKVGDVGSLQVMRTAKEMMDDEVRRSLGYPEGKNIVDDDRRQMVTLDLRGAEIADHDISHLKVFQNLETLYLVNASINGEGLRYLASLPKLRVLYLNDTQLVDSGLIYLADLRKLERLDIPNTLITGDGMEHLQGLRRLQHLDLSNTQVSDVGIKPLSNLKSLVTLILNRTLVTGSVGYHLQDLPRIRRLFFHDTRVGDSLIKDLGNCLGLKEIRLGETDVTNEGLQHMVSLVNLVHLYLSKTIVSDEGVECLVKLRKLESVDLRETVVSDGGIGPLVKLPKLSWLALDGCRITDDGLSLLQEALMLKTLYIAHIPQISDKGIGFCARIKNLTTLYSRGNRITDGCISHLASMKTLKKLDIQNTQISEEGVRQLRESLPACQISY